MAEIQVVFVPAGGKAEVRFVDNGLKAMQKLVGGLIEQFCPFEDEVAIICNDEGKLNGCLPNRAVLDADGNVLDIIFGDFFVCMAESDNSGFTSLSDELVRKYQRLFRCPETFSRDKDGNVVVTKMDA